jgi:hypothetical protein
MAKNKELHSVAVTFFTRFDPSAKGLTEDHEYMLCVRCSVVNTQTNEISRLGEWVLKRWRHRHSRPIFLQLPPLMATQRPADDAELLDLAEALAQRAGGPRKDRCRV